MMVALSRQVVICWLKCTCDKDCNDGGPLRADGDYVGSGFYSSFVPSPSVLSTEKNICFGDVFPKYDIVLCSSLENIGSRWSLEMQFSVL